MSSSSSSSINNIYDESQQKQPSKPRIKVKISKKRPRSSEPSDADATEQTSTSASASDDQVQTELAEHKCVCGVCHEPLHLDGTSISTSTLSSPSASVTVKINLKPTPKALRSPANMNGNGMLNGASSGTRINGIGVPPFLSINAAMDELGSAIISCANEEKSCCRASTRKGYSPHFHFGCLNIPEGSKLYGDLKEFIKYDNERKRHDEEHEGDLDKEKSISKSGNGNRNDNASEDMFDEPEEVLNPFLCPLCDVQGSSKYLYEYFINFRSMKTAYFYNDGEAEDFIQPVGIAQKSDGNVGVEEDYNGLAFENGFVQHLISKQLSEVEETNKNTPFRIKAKQKPTEVTMGHIRDIIKSLPREIDGYIDSNSKDSGHENGNGDGNSFDVSKLNATYLIGQPIRLFCSVTNYYHSGRIIDSRIVEEKDLARLEKTTKQRIFIKHHGGTSPKGKSLDSSSPKQRQRQRHRSRIGRNGKRRSRSKSKSEELNFVDDENKSDVLLDKDIGRTQYLVRFRADIEGRKIPVQQWLFLEEHPIMVGVAIIWARFDEQRDPSKTIVPTGSNLSATVASPSKISKLSPSSPGRMRHPKKARSKFRPVQIFVRTALEMMHVSGVVDTNSISSTITSGTRDIDDQSTATAAMTTSTSTSTLNGSKSNKTLDVIGFLFGPKHRCLRIQLSKTSQQSTDQFKSLPIIKESVSLSYDKKKDADANLIHRSPRNILERMTVSVAKSTREDVSKAADKRRFVREDRRKEAVDNSSETAVSLLDTSLRDLFIADFHNPPKKLIQYLKLIKTYDDQLVYATAFACLEEEEMRRVVEGHTTIPPPTNLESAN